MTRDDLMTAMTIERNTGGSERGPHQQSLADLRSIIAALAQALDEADYAGHRPRRGRGAR